MIIHKLIPPESLDNIQIDGFIWSKINKFLKSIANLNIIKRFRRT